MPTLPPPDTMYAAVTANDAAFDDVFVYAVTSTGIFCRPSCASRDPKPSNVAYFATSDEASAAGYRPCKRCQPTQATPDTAASLVAQVCAYIEANLTTADLSLDALAAHVGYSPYHLQRTFKAVTGVSPKVYADGLRMSHFKGAVREGRSVTDAIYGAGYSSSSRLYDRVAAELGMTPTEYGEGGTGQTIVYATAPCPLGVLLVAGTARGLCSVQLGDDTDALVAALASDYPAASLVAGAAPLESAVEAILAHIAGNLPHLDLPLDVQATAFQRQVWDALRRIPYGETRSYAQVAAMIGKPTASRAVGSACGANPVALVVPCHRVTRANGDTGAYRWGAARKKALLNTERART
jgi:AraC family transcriptional regulator of adaptative response/methylated-DNA-[protein]-cysteine methyltransferase